MATIVKEVSGQGILDLLKKGYVRYTADKVAASPAVPASEGVEAKDAVEASPGSVQEVYGLTRTKLAEFLQHPRLKNFRYIAPKPIVLKDDFEITFKDDFDAPAEQEAPAAPAAPAEPVVAAAPTVAPVVAPIVVPVVEAAVVVAVEDDLDQIMASADLQEAELFS